MLCLGIETSCDDTSLALVQDGKLLAEATASQVAVHALFGGVVPEIASREHNKFIGLLCDKVFADAGKHPQEVDVVSVARGPGLLGSLLVGVSFAKSFALGTGAKLIGVNHLHAHMLAAGLEVSLEFPCIGLLVSGGHTHLYRIEAIDSFTLLGKTLDDAAGEAFDKAGKMLGLPYPAGKFIDMLAQRGNATTKLFPRPYLDNDNVDFSFSGLKTAMATFLQKNAIPRVSWDVQSAQPNFAECAPPQQLCDVCAAYSEAVVDTLTIKLTRAMERHTDIKGIVLAGGVAANTMLRMQVGQVATKFAKKFIVPSFHLCTDNGAMIAHLGYMLAQKGYFHASNFESVPRGKAFPDDMKKAPVVTN